MIANASEMSIHTPCVPPASPAQAASLFEHAIFSLSIAREPAVLRAFAQIGVEEHLVAQLLGVDPREVTYWCTGQKSIAREHRVMLLAYMSALLGWLFGAQSNLNESDAGTILGRQRIEDARRLTDLELQADPALAREVRIIADEIDAVSRREALHVFAEWASRSVRKPPRHSPSLSE